MIPMTETATKARLSLLPGLLSVFGALEMCGSSGLMRNLFVKIDRAGRFSVGASGN
jgi:hypothetical protein